MVSQKKNPRKVLHPDPTTDQGHETDEADQDQEVDQGVEADQGQEAEVLRVIPVTLIVPIILTDVSDVVILVNNRGESGGDGNGDSGSIEEKRKGAANSQVDNFGDTAEGLGV